MKIVLGVTGSVSAYKSIELLRLLVKDEHEVKVVLSTGALKFVKAELFSYLGATEVFSPESDFDFPHNSKSSLPGTVLHVELSKWADKFVIAPLSANTLSNLCSAKASDLLTSLFLAWDSKKNILAFPAMNTKMFEHPFVQKNLKQLSSLPNLFLAPTQIGELACGDSGKGKLLELEKIFHLILTINKVAPRKLSKKILMNAGATVSPLDDVRFLTNASSGKTAIPFIVEALKRGHQVTVVAGVYATKDLELFTEHPCFILYRVRTTEDMLQEIEKYFEDCDTYISMAAIGDIQFKTEEGKLKKEALSDALDIQKSPDILKHMLALRKSSQTIIGFAAETSLTDEVLLEKIKRKPVDLLVGTEVNSGLKNQSSVKGFGTSNATYRFITKKETLTLTPPEVLSKKQLAQMIALEHF